MQKTQKRLVNGTMLRRKETQEVLVPKPGGEGRGLDQWAHRWGCLLCDGLLLPPL